MSKQVYVKDLVEIMRSKNAGPFRLTFDLFFKSETDFDRAAHSQKLTKKNIAALFGLKVEDVLLVQSFKPALGIKITIRRPVPSGAVGDRDVYGAQQHAPLLELTL